MYNFAQLLLLSLSRANLYVCRAAPAFESELLEHENIESAIVQHEHAYTPGMFDNLPNPNKTQSIAGPNRDEIMQILKQKSVEA